MIPQNLVRILIFVAGCALALYAGNAAGDFFTLSLIVALCASVFFIVRPGALVILCVALYQTTLSAPSLPGRIHFFHLCAVGLIVVIMAHTAIRSPRVIRGNWPAPTVWLLFFMGIIVVTMACRGMGFRFMHDGTEGGMLYVSLLVCASLSFTLPRVLLSPRAWKWTLSLFLLGSLLPVLDDILVIHNVFAQMAYIRGSEQISDTYALSQADTLVRFFSAGSAGSNLTLVPFLFADFATIFSLPYCWMWLWFPGCLGLIFFSGYRGVLITSIVTVLRIGWVQRGLTILRVCLLISLLLISYLSIVLNQDRLPSGAIRVLSWMPGIQADASGAKVDATNTAEWRLTLWKECLPLIPQYFWIGKGYIYSQNDYYDSQKAIQQGDDYQWAIVTSSIHNGHLSLLICFGIFGSIFGYGYLFSTLWRHYWAGRGKWHDATLKRCHQVASAYLFILIAIFLTYYGDVDASFPIIFVLTGICEAIYRRDLLLRRDIPALEEPVFPAPRLPANEFSLRDSPVHARHY